MLAGDDPDDVEPLDPGEWTLRDEAVREYVREAALGVESLVRSTFGPQGLEKLIETQNTKGSRELVQTTDAVEILKALERSENVSHPVAALFIDAVDSMQRGLGDGATTAIVLAAALVDRGLDLVEEGLHPTSVVIGYAIAANRAGEVLDDLARDVSPDDTETLEAIAATSMAVSDLPADDRRRYAEHVAAAVRGLDETTDDGWLDTDDVKVLARTNVEDRLHRGLVVRRWPSDAEQSDNLLLEFDYELAFREPAEDVTVAILDEIDFEKTATVLSQQGHTGMQLASGTTREYTDALDRRRDETASRVADLGVDLLAVQERLDDSDRGAFQRAGVAVIDDIKYPLADVTRLADATGATVESNVDDVTDESLGTAGRVVEEWVGEERWTIFDDCRDGVFTLVADAGAEVAAEQRERVLEDAIEVTALAAMDEQALPGAGAPAVATAMAVRDHATTVDDRSQLAVEAFADALEELVGALATNGGHDPTDVLTTLRAAHAEADDPSAVGFDAVTGESIDAWDAGVVEPRRVFSQAVETGRAAAEQLLTVDAVLFPGVDFDSYEILTEHASSDADDE